MRSTTRRLLLLLLLLALPALHAAADDEAPKAEDPPSPLVELKDEYFEAEAEPTNPIEYLRSFHEWLVKHEAQPPRTRLDSALYDVWRAALRPRASRMSNRIEKLMQRKYWLPEEGEPTHVKPEEWSRFVREMAGLMTELHGAWMQYDSARVLVKRGIPVHRVRPYGSYYGYGNSVGLWRRARDRRVRVGARHGPTALGAHAPGANPGTGTIRPGVSGAGGGALPGVHHRGGGRYRYGLHLGLGELYSYRHLLHRYRRGWGWRIQHCYGCELRRQEKQKQLEDFVAERQAMFDTTRDTLQQQMLSLQVLAAAMQAEAEHALNNEFAKAPADDSRASLDLQTRVSTALFKLRSARLVAERYAGDSSAQYGHLLRGWVRAYKAANALLKEATAPAEDKPSDG